MSRGPPLPHAGCTEQQARTFQLSPHPLPSFLLPEQSQTGPGLPEGIALLHSRGMAPVWRGEAGKGRGFPRVFSLPLSRPPSSLRCPPSSRAPVVIRETWKADGPLSFPVASPGARATGLSSPLSLLDLRWYRSHKAESCPSTWPKLSKHTVNG